MEDVRFEALDGRTLAGTRFDAPSAQAALVLNSALGVKRGYYARFAQWLAERGVSVWTYDYRGIGDSVVGHARDERGTLLDWGQQDVSGAIAAARSAFPGLPLFGLGHSFGGQAFGLAAHARDLDGVVVVAAGSGDLRLYPTYLAWKYGILLGSVPIVHAAFGYVPRQLGLGEDLPTSVVGQWAQFCRTPGYVRGAIAGTHYDEIRAPMAFVEVTDDDYAPRAAAAELRSWYTAARGVQHRVYAPADLGVDAIGHFGIFRRGPAERIWGDVRGFISAQA